VVGETRTVGCRVYIQKRARICNTRTRKHKRESNERSLASAMSRKFLRGRGM
jgi:hypothetical protein